MINPINHRINEEDPLINERRAEICTNNQRLGFAVLALANLGIILGGITLIRNSPSTFISGVILVTIGFCAPIGASCSAVYCAVIRQSYP